MPCGGCGASARACAGRTHAIQRMPSAWAQQQDGAGTQPPPALTRANNGLQRACCGGGVICLDSRAGVQTNRLPSCGKGATSKLRAVSPETCPSHRQVAPLRAPLAPLWSRGVSVSRSLWPCPPPLSGRSAGQAVAVWSVVADVALCREVSASKLRNVALLPLPLRHP